MSGRCLIRPAIALCVAMSYVGVATAATITVNSAADTYVRRDDSTTSTAGSTTYMYLRENGDGVTPGSRDYKGYVRFDLSSLGAITINSASVKFTKATTDAGLRNDTIVTGRFALNGLNDVAGNTAQDWDESVLTYSNAGADRDLTNVTSLDDSVIGISEVVVNGGVEGGTVTVSGAPLVSFLQSRVDAGSFAGLVSFVLDFPPPTADRAYGLATKEHANSDYHPMLTLDYEPAIPEPASLSLLALAAVVTGLGIRRRS